jgi:hypothetical protein
MAQRPTAVINYGAIVEMRLHRANHSLGSAQLHTSARDHCENAKKHPKGCAFEMNAPHLNEPRGVALLNCECVDRGAGLRRGGRCGHVAMETVDDRLAAA